MHRLTPLAALALVAATTGWLSPPATARAAVTHTVEVRDYAFIPATITIQAGDSVTWVNSDDVAHTATSTAGAPAAFDTGLIDGGQSASLTFTVPGTYDYFCIPHPSMTGTVIVNVADGGTLPDAAMTRGITIPGLAWLMLPLGLLGLGALLGRRRAA